MKKITEPEVTAAIDAYLSDLKPGCPARPKVIGKNLTGGKPIPSYLGIIIHREMRERGYYPDPVDTTRESTNRLYKKEERK